MPKVSHCPARNRSYMVSASSESCCPKRPLPKPNSSFADAGVLKGQWLQRIFLGHLCWSGALQRVSNHSWAGWGCPLSPLTWGGSSSSKSIPSERAFSQPQSIMGDVPSFWNAAERPGRLLSLVWKRWRSSVVCTNFSFLNCFGSFPD